MEKLDKCLWTVDLIKMSKILVEFLKFFEKSVEFFAPNTDWDKDRSCAMFQRVESSKP